MAPICLAVCVVCVLLCPTLWSTYDLCNTYVLLVHFPDDDVGDEMPVLRARLHPWRLVISGELEDSVYEQNFMLRSSMEKQAIAFTKSVLSNHTTPDSAVTAQFLLKSSRITSLSVLEMVVMTALKSVMGFVWFFVQDRTLFGHFQIVLNDETLPM